MGIASAVWAALMDVQSWIRQSLSAEISGIARTRDWVSLVLLWPMGIAFGAAHALTPGHGKTVLASYLLGSRMEVTRASLTAFVLAVTHVGTAVILALISTALVRRTFADAGQAPALEMISRGLLLVLGLRLVVRALRHRDHHVGNDSVGVGAIAGLVPCPLTLFIMFFALARDVPEIGFAFATAMAIGVAVPLVLIAVLSVTMRDTAALILARFDGSLDAARRLLDALAGSALIVIGTGALWR